MDRSITRGNLIRDNISNAVQKINNIKPIKKSKNSDFEKIDLKREMDETKQQIKILNNNFMWADSELIDYYSFLLKAYEIKYAYLLKKVRENRNVTAI
jgi:hypothetical protein